MWFVNTGYMLNIALREWMLEISFAEVYQKSVRHIPFSVPLFGEWRKKLEDSRKNRQWRERSKKEEKGKRNRKCILMIKTTKINDIKFTWKELYFSV